MSLDLLLSGTSSLLALVLAGVGFGRPPRHASQPWFAAGLVLLAVETALAGWWLVSPSPKPISRPESVQLAMASLLFGPWLVFSVLYSRGDPKGRIGRMWWAGVSLAPGLAILVLIFPQLGITVRETADGTVTQVGSLGFAVELFALLSSIAILSNLERTFRHAVGLMRWRIKYLVLGVGLLFVYRLFMASQALLYGSVAPHFQRVSAAVLLVSGLFMAIALWRTHAFEVDVYPSHAFLFRSLTIALAGAYLLIVGVLARAVTLLGGDAALPLRALLVLLALTALAIVFMSDRFRQRLRRVVSRHLRRPAFDYRHMWATFTSRTTLLVDEPAYCRAVVNWISETFQVLSASIWLINENRERLRFGASTALADAAARELEETVGDLGNLLPQLAQQRGAFNLDDPAAGGLSALKRLHPGVFAHGGDRLCLPLSAGGELLGLLVLGDRVSGLELSEEDLELLQCVGDQAAAGLLNQQLSRRLLGAKEMEAFQTMSTFFVHDLKNTASSLSLMLQNLEAHFADPEFRADAMRAVGKSVQHLNDLIGRLSQLRQELKLQPVESDLTNVVEAALSVTGQPTRLTLLKELHPVPPVRMDPDQMQKVVQNLVLNAQEAVGTDGKVRVETQRLNDWAVLTVADNGCGITPEFLRHSLFKPFQTTKKRGLGIGMFQSKMIVEAHRGRVEVESVLGEGTTVRVLLPLAERA
ncbi:MAG TPA: PEP-CTERM system histidine kinase PrsK [Verrucomicrobiota bacterium]|nr:PEP-CTERM system histidine kinase PrsK [Verrucomicrobiales bacterium]HRI14641.1 PEP-CTERM system histidine kinase PrsK [Verrucomicrobiota bacterium]